MRLHGGLVQPVSARVTRRAYDLIAPLYPVMSFFFHRRAHHRLMELAGPLDGRRVLEVGTGSGELFRRLPSLNRNGLTVGVDISPGMVAVVRRGLDGRNGNHGCGLPGRYALQAADARHMPFSDSSFDTVFSCYLFEQLPCGGIPQVLAEFRRVLRPAGRLLLANVSEDRPAFNVLYSALGAVVPCYWGPQVSRRLPELLGRSGLRILHTEVVTQSGYPSTITVTERRPAG